MEFVQLACLKSSCIEGHHVYVADLNVGDIFECFLEPENHHSEWAIVVKNTNDDVVIGHVPDGLANLLQPLMLSGEVHRVQAKVTDPPRPAPGGMWLKGGGIVIPCHYILYGQSKEKHGVRNTSVCRVCTTRTILARNRLQRRGAWTKNRDYY